MQFAPDGRLFVCEQGGRLRVIKDGALLATPFVTLTVNSSGERGLLGVAFDPAFARESLRVSLLHGDHADCSQSHQPLHRERRRRPAGSEVVILDLDNLSSATNHNGGALAFGPDGKLYAAVGENANSANAQTLANLLGKMLRLNTDGTIPSDNPFFTHARPAAIAPSGRSACATRSPSRSTRTGRRCSSTTSARTPGKRSTTAGRRELRLAGDRRRDRRSALRVAALHLQPLDRRLRDHRRRFYSPLNAPVPGRLRRRLLLRRLLRRLDSPARSRRRQHRHELRQRHRLAGRPEGDRRRPPVLPRARGRRDDRRRVSRRLRRPARRPSRPQPASRTVTAGAPVTFSVSASGAAPLRYQWQRNGANIAGATAQDYTIAAVAQADNGARFSVVVTNESRQRDQHRGGADRHREPGADRDHHAAGRRHALQRRDGDHLLGDGLGSRGRDRCPRAPSRGRSTSTTTRTRIRSSPPTSGAHERIVHDPDDGRDVRQRVVPHLPDGPRLRRPHAHRRSATCCRARSSSRSRRVPPGCGLRLDGQPVATPHDLRRPSSASSAPSARRRRRRRAAPPTTSSRGPTAAPRPTTSRRRPPTRPTPRPTASRRAATGTGLAATYYDNADFTGTTVARTDPTVNFDWGVGSPAPAIGVDTFSARWTGQVQPQFTETYTFYTQSDDGVRLWVNNVQPSSTTGPTTGDREQRHDRAHGRAALRHQDGVLRERRRRDGAPALEQPVDAEGRRADGEPLSVGGAAAIHDPINFQPAAAPVPAGYLADGGLVYGTRGNGQSYGWTIDNTAQTRDRNASNSLDQRYDTLTHLQKPANPDAIWEIAVVNGTYRVRIVAGDASNFDSVFRTTAEGVLDRERHAHDVDAVARGHRDRRGHRRAAHHPQRRGREQQQDLLRRRSRRPEARAPVSYDWSRMAASGSIGDGAAGREEARRRRDQQHHERGAGHRRRVRRGDAEEQIADHRRRQADGDRREDEAGGEAGREDLQRLAERLADDRPAPGAERHPDAQLRRPLRHRGGGHAEDARSTQAARRAG